MCHTDAGCHYNGYCHVGNCICLPNYNHYRDCSSFGCKYLKILHRYLSMGINMIFLHSYKVSHDKWMEGNIQRSTYQEI